MIALALLLPACCRAGDPTVDAQLIAAAKLGNLG